MYLSTKGVLLSLTKHTESKLILNLYTQQHGRLAAMVRVGKTQKSRQILSSLYAFSIHNLEYKYNVNGLSLIKEISIAEPTLNIRHEIIKSSIAQFLAEFTTVFVEESEENSALFEFITTSIRILNNADGNLSEFHISFLIKLCAYTGILPNNNYTKIRPFFNYDLGEFVIQYDRGNTMNADSSFNFSRLLGMNFAANSVLKLNKSSRNEIVRYIIKYYQRQLKISRELKSFDIFASVFN